MQPCIQTLFSEGVPPGSLPPRPVHPVRYTLLIAGKVAIATAILVYLARTQRLGLSRLWLVLQRPSHVIVLLAAMLLLVLVLAARTRSWG